MHDALCFTFILTCDTKTNHIRVLRFPHHVITCRSNACSTSYIRSAPPSRLCLLHLRQHPHGLPRGGGGRRRAETAPPPTRQEKQGRTTWKRRKASKKLTIWQLATHHTTVYRTRLMQLSFTWGGSCRLSNSADLHPRADLPLAVTSDSTKHLLPTPASKSINMKK